MHEPHVDVRPDPDMRIFQPMAPRLVGNGWSVFPQDRTERRAPATFEGSPIVARDYASRLPSLDEVSRWGEACPAHNVACALGPASGDVFGIDIDVTDEGMVRTICGLATLHLGETPYRRVGRHPRMLLLYRQATDDGRSEVERIGSRAYAFVDGEALGGGIDVLADGKAVTFYGLHHKTGAWFQWMDLHPMRDGPGKAPLVTRQKLDGFLAAVAQVRAFRLG